MKLFIAPHPDDETLFGAYTILRNKSLVVICTYPTLQGDNGDTRLSEAYEACKVLGVPVCFLKIPEHNFDRDTLLQGLAMFDPACTVYAPHKEGGNPHHDLVHDVANSLFDRPRYYRTYAGLEDRSIGVEVVPTTEERQLKIKAMACYKSQIENPDTRHYFETDKEYV
jgi:LmbE family N-acetylglucosaminyl deacetylase